MAPHHPGAPVSVPGGIILGQTRYRVTEDSEYVARKFKEVANKVSRWLREQLEPMMFEAQKSENINHPGRVFHRRTRQPKAVVREYAGGPVYKGNPHLGSWKRYTKHLFDLMLEGHGGSPAAMQVRDRLNFHWRFLGKEERTECLKYYRTTKQRFEETKMERQLRTSQFERDLAYTENLRAEVDRFMNPKTH